MLNFSLFTQQTKYKINEKQYKNNIVQRFKIQYKFQYFQIAYQPWKQERKKKRRVCCS